MNLNDKNPISRRRFFDSVQDGVHGAALIWVSELNRFMRRRPAWDRVRHTIPYRLGSVAVTISFVAGVSSIANAGGSGAAWALVRRVFGL